ncbi:cell wall anchor protein [Actinorugispora endophytica]|uniref:Uncharacterized protein n=1 Tax=Actinorugispora endophytica TaxID=1605990 RepID=A0A4R6V0K7_9ACTN|nr:cell wall anchor protein [Actinorugispora endophytica]TDQ53332.1 hypothetical protein EV190_104121 [Actinorugispora endophytica]
MTSGQLWVLIGLGVFHGVNPGMGWPFAVSRGLQERSRAAVVGALPALALGHAASVALVAVAVTATGTTPAARWFTVGGGLVVCAAGAWLLLRPTHAHRPPVRVPLRRLAAWSFVMSLLHGSGLMLLPVLAGRVDGGAAAAGGHSHGVAAVPAPSPSPAPAAPGLPDLFDATLLGLAAAGVHTLAMVAATGVAALVVHDFFAVHALRLRWATMDRVWALSLIAGGVFVLWSARH